MSKEKQGLPSLGSRIENLKEQLNLRKPHVMWRSLFKTSLTVSLLVSTATQTLANTRSTSTSVTSTSATLRCLKIPDNGVLSVINRSSDGKLTSQGKVNMAGWQEVCILEMRKPRTHNSSSSETFNP